MNEPPLSVTTDEVLDLVRQEWSPQVTSLVHLPVGFGGWHWRADLAGVPAFFVTLDQPLWHDAVTAEATYAGAAELGRSLDFVLAPLVSARGTVTVPCGTTWLSCTPWVPGTTPSRFGADAAGHLRRLHATPPPAGLSRWEPQVDPGLVDLLRDWTQSSWGDGPHGEPARAAVLAGLPAVDAGLAAYLPLSDRVDPADAVVTHGEPDVHNQWRTDGGRLLLLDWETLRLAPRERDLLNEGARHIEHDPHLLELFRLEWQLSEVQGYAEWLRGPHTDDADTRTALAGLQQELSGLPRA